MLFIDRSVNKGVVVARSIARVRDPNATRASVLSAAESLFAEKGFAGTSMRDLAKASGVSQPLIHHHFGSKQELYNEVKRRVIERYRDLQRPVARRKSTNLEVLMQELIAVFRFFRDNQTVTRMVSWTRLEGTTGLWPGEEELMRALSERIREAQEGGELRDDIDPLMLTIIAGGMTFFWWEERERYQNLFPEIKEINALDETYLEEMLKVFMQGVSGSSGCTGGERVR